MKKLTRLQKEVIGLICMMIALFVGSTYLPHEPQNEYPGMIRLHVIANSDTPEDQILKKKVRNVIIHYMDGQESLEEARVYIDDHLPAIEKIASDVIADCGGTYGATAKRSVTFIPEKSYEDLTLPAGNYEALQVTLGEGKGQNWWCVIFPQLCLVGEERGDEKIILKSRIKEMLKNQVNEDKEMQ